MIPREKPDEPGADILPDTPEPGTPPAEQERRIEEEGEPFDDNFA